MMKWLVSSSVVLLLLGGCIAHTVNEPVFDQPPSTNKKTPVLVLVSPVKHTDLAQMNVTNVGVTSTHAAFKKTAHPSLKKDKNKIAPTLTDGFMRVSYDACQQPVVQTAPFQITVIQLEPGEQFTNISSGDPSRWSYAVATSGQGPTAQQNILVKPCLPDIQTNLVITTDKRLYTLRLLSAQTLQPTRTLNFEYPNCSEDADQTSPLKAPFLKTLTVPIKSETIWPARPAKHSHYHITTAGFFSRSPPWQPLCVFDDEVHTTIEFPASIAQSDLPVLLVLNNGQKECVNYRFKAPYMIVDKIFDEATLISGVGSAQTAVLIHHLTN